VELMHATVEQEPSISLLVAEHSRMGCHLMETALRRCRHITVTQSVVESMEALEGFKATNPDVCIISSALKDGPTAGFRVARELRKMNKTSALILILDAPERALVLEAFRSGARGILSRDDPFDTLQKCILKVHEGQIWANTQQLTFLLESLFDEAPAPIRDAKGAALLTSRELSLVQLVAEGRTNRDISQELRLSEHTVRNYLFRIFNKLGVSTRLELALYAINHRNGSDASSDSSQLPAEP
jgi:DNA-binding NarL/FixJ family response regulator